MSVSPPAEAGVPPASRQAEIVLVALRGEDTVAFTAPYENITLGTVSAHLAAHGVPALLLDESLAEQGRLACLDAARSARMVVVDAAFRTMAESLGFCRALRELGATARLVLLGDAARCDPEGLIEGHPELDAVVLGEPEPTVLALYSRTDWVASVPGAVVRAGGRVRPPPAGGRGVVAGPQTTSPGRIGATCGPCSSTARWRTCSAAAGARPGAPSAWSALVTGIPQAARPATAGRPGARLTSPLRSRTS
jgi:hypothetical protein